MKEADSEADIFRGSNPSPQNDRYVVYRMLNRMVSFRAPGTVQKVTGYVDEVYRDIFTGEVRLTVDGQPYRFKEPVVFRDRDKEVVFVYGDVGKHEVSDARLFSELRSGQYRETAKDTMNRLDRKRVREMRFVVGEKRPSRRKPFLMRGIAAVIPLAV